MIRKPARPGREGAVPAVLQGHLDMVCEKNEGTAHNFDTDPIRLVRDGDWLKADGTTLGADNGVGVAAALAVMENADMRPRPAGVRLHHRRGERPDRRLANSPADCCRQSTS